MIEVESEVETLREQVAELQKELDKVRAKYKKQMFFYRSLENQNNDLAIRLGDTHRELIALKEFISGQLDNLERLREVQARGLLF